MPYLILPCDASSVVQVIAAELVVIEDTATPEMTGGVTSARGANIERWLVYPETVLLWYPRWNYL